MATIAEQHPGVFKEAVVSAIDEIREHYRPDRVRVVPDGQGGAWVEIADVELGGRFVNPTTFVIVQLQFTLPNADVYPMFVTADLARVDRQPLGEGYSMAAVGLPNEPASRPVVQVSRRTRGTDFPRQTPLQKIDKVLQWMLEPS